VPAVPLPPPTAPPEASVPQAAAHPPEPDRPGIGRIVGR
jgi:hypothetical protein